MELVPCPIAGDRDFTPWIEAPDRFNLHGPTWTIVRSNSSGLVMLNPRPVESEASRHYPSASYDPFLHPGNSRSLRDRAYLSVSNLLLGRKTSIVMSGLRKPAKHIRVLDVGCSSGRMLLHLHRRRRIPLENLFGVEPDPVSRNAARAAGLGNVHGDLLDATPFGCHFDRIVFWHSLEHIHRIGCAIDAARNLLEPDGMLVVALPNIGSHDSVRYGREWVALDAPRHLWHFTPGSLGSILKRHGLSVVDVRPYHPDACYHVWYSEKLRCDATGKGFGVKNAVNAVVCAGASVLAGIDPARSSGFVCRALKR
ncbi:MAG: class I SAM-dependent methyltransferase [Chlorobiaceae bacterium]|nr:class I SAM-dependent methyltransferase [Chlorobiaceae bacterium]NTW75272.1 class I SAM-dependent methyltransferase [Chlorobiaceae bacterium]